MSERTLGWLWDSVLPGMICLNPMAMAYYLAIVLHEMPLTAPGQATGTAIASGTTRDGAMIGRVSATRPQRVT